MELVTFLHITIESGLSMLCIIMAIYLRLYDHGSHRHIRVETGGLLLNAFINIMDAMAYFFRGDLSDTGFFMVRITNYSVFAGMFLLIVAGSMLFDAVLEERSAGSDKRLRNASCAVSLAGPVLILVLRRFGLLYTFGDNDLYSRGRAYALIPLMALTALALVIARIVKERASLSQKEYAGYLCFFLLPVAGTLAQSMYYGISLANVANSIVILTAAMIFFRSIIAEVSVKRSFILSGETIDRISDDIGRFLERTGTERQNRIRIRFTVEEALLSIWRRFGDPSMVRVSAGIRLGIPSIRIEHAGESFNPFRKTETGNEDWSSNLLASAGISPAYSYSRGMNTVKIAMSRLRINPVVTVILAILFGLITGGVAMIALSESDAVFLMDEVLVPVYDLWSNILYSVAAPAMLIIVMSTMLDTREVAEQGGSAGLITGRYFAISLAAGAFTLVMAMLVSGNRLRHNPFSRYQITGILKKLFSVIPENLLDPLKDFNTAQLILMGIIFAYAIMAVGQQAGGLVSIIRQLNLISTQLAQWISDMMPLFTVFLTAQLMLRHNAQLLLSTLTILPFAVGVSLLVLILVMIYAARETGVSSLTLLKKLWPSFVLTLRTGQVADSYALAEKTCIRDLGIQKIFTQKVLPLGLVLYMPASMVGMCTFVLYAAIRSGIGITPMWMLTAIVFVLILLVAAPPIPGINLLSYVVIIEQLGISSEYILAAMIFDIIFNVFASAANQMMLQTDMLLQAEHVGLLDHEKLAVTE